MVLGIRKRYWSLLLLTLIMAGAAIFAQVSPIFAVRRARIVGPLAEKAVTASRVCLKDNANLFSMDKNRLLDEALSHDEIGNINLQLVFPNGLCAEVNRFEPVALVMGTALYGLDSICRLIPYDTAWNDVNYPVLTGLKAVRLFQAPRDFRLADVVRGLMLARSRRPELYRRLAEIDFSDPVLIGIYVTTGPEIYLATGRSFGAQLEKLYAVSRLLAAPDSACYHLQYDGLVIRKKYEAKNVADTALHRT